MTIMMQPSEKAYTQSWLSSLTSRVLMNILSQLPRKTALAATQCCRTLYEAHADLVPTYRCPPTQELCKLAFLCVFDVDALMCGSRCDHRSSPTLTAGYVCPTTLTLNRPWRSWGDCAGDGLVPSSHLHAGQYVFQPSLLSVIHRARYSSS